MWTHGEAIQTGNLALLLLLCGRQSGYYATHKVWRRLDCVLSSERAERYANGNDDIVFLRTLRRTQPNEGLPAEMREIL